MLSRRFSVLLLAVVATVAQAALPEYVSREWSDFPVRIEVRDPGRLEELDRLLAERGPSDHDHVVDGFIELRITPLEFGTLTRAGFAPQRIDDTTRAARSATEVEWAARRGVRGVADFTWPLTSYPTHEEVGQILLDLETLRPDLARRYDYGTSVDGRLLWGLVISDHPDANEVEPEVRLASGIHGDETVQMVNLLNLAHELVTREGTGDARIDVLVAETELHVQPLFNPDGYVRGVRRNANAVDLNRNFPEPVGGNDQEDETLAFMQHALSKNFVVSLMGHGGALVVNYPYDYTYTRAPDDAALILLSLEYSQHNTPMYQGNFSQGITNGADWYVATGTLQDWVYHRTGCFDVTLEVSNAKWPPASTLVGFWNDNRESLLSFVEAARAGLRGVVTDAVTGDPLAATVRFDGFDRVVNTDPATGDWYKLVETGDYTITIEAIGYEPRVFSLVSNTWGDEDVLDVALVPEATSTPPVVARGPRIDAIAPNPFNPRTRIEFTLPDDAAIVLSVLDARGRRVRTLLEERWPAGSHRVVWEGDDDAGHGVGAGVYFVQLAADGIARTASVTFVP